MKTSDGSGVMALVVLLAACTAAPQASPTVRGSPTPTPIASPIRVTASPSPSDGTPPSPTFAPTPRPMPSLTPAPAPTPQPVGGSSGFEIEWRKRAGGFGDGDGERDIAGSAVIDNRIVVVGTRWYYGDPIGESAVPTIWWEDGDLVWRLADVPVETDETELSAIVAGGPGLVVVGQRDYGERALLWLSSDGKTWQSADASALDGFVWGGHGPRLYAAENGLILIGRDGEAGGRAVALISADGQDWRMASDPTTQDVAGAYAFAGSGAGLTAFEKRVDSDGCDGMTGGTCRAGPVRVWRASGADSWTAVAELPASDDAWVHAAATGARGWVAVGESPAGPLAWWSADGITWHVAEAPPQGPRPRAMFAVSAGFVAVHFYQDDPGCTIEEQGSLTRTWTSSDGRIWRLVHETAAGDRLYSLRRRGERLIGIGLTASGAGGTWTARLPETSSDSGPPPTPQPSPSGQGCGDD